MEYQLIGIICHIGRCHPHWLLQNPAFTSLMDSHFSTFYVYNFFASAHMRRETGPWSCYCQFTTTSNFPFTVGCFKGWRFAIFYKKKLRERPEAEALLQGLRQQLAADKTPQGYLKRTCNGQFRGDQCKAADLSQRNAGSDICLQLYMNLRSLMIVSQMMQISDQSAALVLCDSPFHFLPSQSDYLWHLNLKVPASQSNFGTI